ncbi:hypothetical protein QA089_005560 [Meyerozyma guilliermondii]
MVLQEITIIVGQKLALLTHAIRAASLGVVLSIVVGLMTLFWIDVITYMYILCRKNAEESSFTFVATSREQVTVMVSLKQYVTAFYWKSVSGAKPGVVRLLKRKDDK